MSDSKHPILNSAVLLTAATAFLYCISTAYFGGYLHSLHLDADVLDRNFHQVLYNGFLISFTQVLVSTFVYAIVRILYSRVFLPSLTDWLRRARVNRRRYIKARRALFGKRKHTEVERRQRERTTTALGYCALSFVFFLVLVYFEGQGKKDALAIMKQIEAGKAEEVSSIVHVKIEDKVKNLFCLGCGARNCAGIDLASKTIYYFQQNGHSYQYAAPSKPAPPSSATSP